MTPWIDGHLDIAWWATGWERPFGATLDTIRTAEADLLDDGRGIATVSLPAMRDSHLKLCFASVLARCATAEHPVTPGRSARSDIVYPDVTTAQAAAAAQLHWYEQADRHGQIHLIRDARQLDAHLQSPDKTPGVILMMEGADPIRDAAELSWWYERGIRMISLTHYGPGRYAMGTGGDGPLTGIAPELLREMDRLNIILDTAHLADASMAEAWEYYEGTIVASHANVRKRVDNDRQLTDAQILQIAERGGVVGIAMMDRMITSQGPATWEDVADHIDHIAQLTGSDRHVGIGSDLDGGFGKDNMPQPLDHIGDILQLHTILQNRGYSDAAQRNIFHDNWLRIMKACI